MPNISKGSMYPDWDLDFMEYWDIQDDSDRQQHLLDFFKKCGVLEPGEGTELNAIALSKMQLDKVIMFPSDLGKRKIHLKKGFAKLRQCYLAEVLYKNGCAKELISKNLVTHCVYEERDEERWRTLQRLGGRCVEFACIYTPVSRFQQTRNARKEEGGEKLGTFTRISSTIMAPLSGRKRSLNESSADYNNHESGPAMIGNSNVPNMQEAPQNSFIYRLSDKLKTPFSFRKRSRLNDLAGSDSAQTRDSSKTALTASPSVHEESPNGICPMSTPLTKSNLNERFSALPALPGVVQTDQVVDNSTQDLHNSSPLLACGQHHEATYPDINLTLAPLETPQKDTEEMHQPPESNADERSTTKKFGLSWNTSAESDATKLSERRINELVREISAIIHSKTNEDLMKAIEIVKRVGERLHSTRSGPTAQDKVEVDDDSQGKEMVMSNIKAFFSMSQFKSKGRRKHEVQSSMIAAVTSLLSPENGFYTVLSLGSSGKFPVNFEQCPVLEKNIERTKEYETFKIVTPIGYLYCSKETLEFYRQTEPKISHRYLNTCFNVNRRLLQKCQVHRNALYCGGRPFDEMISKQAKRWDNFDSEIQDAIFLMGHDPEYVRPDNYCSQKYSCYDSDGSICKHHGRRHNWMINGNLRSQHEIFMDSTYFQNLVSHLRELNPTRQITDDLVRSKVTYRKFKSAIPKCVKPETRASCVDPIEAPAYDFARCLQLHFKGIQAVQNRLRMRYQQSQHNFYDADADTDDEEDILGESEDNSSDEEEMSERGDTIRTLYEKLERCTCPHCRDKKGWLQIFDQIKDETPHNSLLRYCLCTPIEHPHLTLKDSNRIYTLYDWKCCMQECSACGVGRNLPFDCPVILNCVEKINVWVWTKTTGDNERTGKKLMQINEVFEGLRTSLETYSKHTGPLQMWNQGRRISVANLLNLPFKMVCMTDFSSQMDLVPVRKVNCHVNKHASLGIFVLLFQESANVDGEEIKYIACHEWYVFGSCEEKGKQNDWIFHNKAQEFIQSHNLYRTIECWEWFTDNCPGQYKCRQNLYQVAKKTIVHSQVKEFTHNFAKQHGFKNKSDTIGHWMKEGIKKKEDEYDVHASNALFCAQLAERYAEEKKTKLEWYIENHRGLQLSNDEKKKFKTMLRRKSPYDCTQRHVAYIEDNKATYEKYKCKLPNMNIFYSDRTRMKEDEDIDVIKDTTQFYSFSHKRADDNPNVNSLDQIPLTGDNEHTCRWCHKRFKNGGKAFKDHVKLCTELASTGKAHKINYKFFKCLCWQCQAGNHHLCDYRDFAGEEKYKFVASKKDIEKTKIILKEREQQEKSKKIADKCQEVISKLSIPPYPLLVETKWLKMEHWKAIKELLSISAETDAGDDDSTKKKVLKKADIISDISRKGEWDVIIPLLKQRLSHLNQISD